MNTRTLLPALSVLLAGCAMLQPVNKEMDAAARQITAAEQRLKTARDAGAAAFDPKDLKQAESDLQTARNNHGKKAYAMALTMARSAESYADTAVKKSEEAKRKEAELKAKTKKK